MRREPCEHCGAKWLKESQFSDFYRCGARRLKDRGTTFRTGVCYGAELQQVKQERDELKEKLRVASGELQEK